MTSQACRQSPPEENLAPQVYIQKSYAICTNPRSGSWLLSEGLASTSLAGNPREWFNNAEEQDRRAKWSVERAAEPSRSAYIEYIQERGTTPNGVFGLKLHYYQFAELPSKFAAIAEHRGLPSSQLLTSVFPGMRYVWLTRRDKARQALSYYRACKTNRWWEIDGDRQAQSATSSVQPQFDPKAIEQLEFVLQQNDSSWSSHFESTGVRPLTIYYEDLVADYAGTILHMLNWLEVAGAGAVYISPPRLKRQSDSKSEEWLTQYLAHKEGGLHSATRPAHAPEPPTAPNPRNAAQDTHDQDSLVVLRSPLYLRNIEAAKSIPNSWKRWLAENQLNGVASSILVDTLIRNGFEATAVAAELARSESDPYLTGSKHIQQRLHKATCLLNMFQSLSNIQAGANHVERRIDVSSDEFLTKYYAANRPVILQGLMHDWRAMTKWTPEYLKERVGEEQIEVMSDRDSDPLYEMNSAAHRRAARFSDYIDLVYNSSPTNDHYLVANNAFFRRPAGQALLADIGVFCEYMKRDPSPDQTFLWFGPPGTVTPLHHDTSNILMAQIAGRKRIRMIPANQWPHVYNNVGVFSDVDIDSPDLARWPQFAGATILDVTLEPGEVLFIPVGWWHHVVSLCVSMTVSFTNFAYPNSYKW